MLYKNKIKGQNILKSAVALMLMLTLSLSTALSPLAKAEEAKYTWKTLTSVPASVDNVKGTYASPDGSKLFIMQHNFNETDVWMSVDDGATWRKIFSEQGAVIEYMSISTDGSKIILTDGVEQRFYISTDGGQNWTEKAMWATPAEYSLVQVSPDGSFLAGCNNDHNVDSYTTYISTDNGQTWTQKGTNSLDCPSYIFNNGTMIATGNANNIAKSTDYGQTWTEISNFSNNVSTTSFSNNGNNVFDGNRISLDGGNHWTPSNAQIPAGYRIYQTGISDDGKKLYVTANPTLSAPTSSQAILLASTDGGRTWHLEDLRDSSTIMSGDGSKMFSTKMSGHAYVFSVGTLSTPQPVTPGAGAGGTATPSASTSAAFNQKPGKASGRLAETGTSTWTIGGLAVVAVAAGALVLRKRL